jgi:hypothetical protein
MSIKIGIKNSLSHFLLITLICTASVQSWAGVRVFHSPADNGTAPTELAVLEPGVHTLHLYMEAGSTASQGAPCDVGDGQEVCQWVINSIGDGPVTFESFSPVGDVKWSIDGQSLTATGGNFEFGQLGVFKIGDLVISSQGAGSVAFTHGEVALADLSLAPIPGGDLVLLPEASGDLLFFSGVMGMVIVQSLRAQRSRSRS